MFWIKRRDGLQHVSHIRQSGILAQEDNLLHLLLRQGCERLEGILLRRLYRTQPFTDIVNSGAEDPSLQDEEQPFRGDALFLDVGEIEAQSSLQYVVKILLRSTPRLLDFGALSIQGFLLVRWSLHF